MVTWKEVVHGALARLGTAPRRTGLATTLGLALFGPALVAAQPDTTAAQKVIGDLKPTYNTAYNVARQTTEWNQDFQFGSGFHFLNFTNRTQFNVRTDDGRDETRRGGSNQLDLTFNTLPFLLGIHLDRDAVGRPGDERQGDQVDMTLNLKTFSKKLVGIKNDVNFGGGFSRRSDLSVLTDRRSESVNEGWNGDAGWRSFYSPTEDFTVNTNLAFRRSDRTSRLQEEGKAAESRPTANRVRSLNVAVHYAPVRWVATDVTLLDNAVDDQVYTVQGGRGALEQKVSTNRSVAAKFEILKNIPNLGLTFDVQANEHDLDLQVQKDRASRGNGLSWSGNLKTIVWGTDVKSTLSSQEDVLTPATSAATENRIHLFEGELIRTVIPNPVDPAKPPKVSAKFNWLMRTNQLFFNESTPSRTNDRDELRTKLQPSLMYRPNDRWTVNASYVRSTTRRIELNPSRANQTRSDEDFTVDMAIGYKLSATNSLNQTYSIKALYTTFDFSPGQDRLLATQRITTGLTSKLTSRVEVGLEHRFTLQDSGPFRIEAGGNRVFARDLRKYRQELETRLRYNLAAWISLTMETNFLRTDDLNEALDSRSTRRNLDLRQGLEVSQNLQKGMTFKGSASYVRGSFQEPYWAINSSLSKNF